MLSNRDVISHYISELSVLVHLRHAIMSSKPINSSHQTFVERALKVAMKSTMRQKHGCVIVRGATIVAESCNFSVPAFGHGYSIHAEVGAILLAKRARVRLSECTLYVVRYMPSAGSYANSKPCANCSQFIKEHGLSKVFYTNPD